MFFYENNNKTTKTKNTNIYNVSVYICVICRKPLYNKEINA